MEDYNSFLGSAANIGQISLKKKGNWVKIGTSLHNPRIKNCFFNVKSSQKMSQFSKKYIRYSTLVFSRV